MRRAHAGDLFAFGFGILVLLIGGNSLSTNDLLRYGIVMAVAYLMGRSNGAH